jgi:hypothetical protein
MYSMAGHQSATIQPIALAAGKDGKLNGIRHNSITPTSVFDNYIEYAALASRSLWSAGGGISTNRAGPDRPGRTLCGRDRRRGGSHRRQTGAGGQNLNISDAELFARNGLSSLVADGDYDPLEGH